MKRAIYYKNYMYIRVSSTRNLQLSSHTLKYTEGSVSQNIQTEKKFGL